MDIPIWVYPLYSAYRAVSEQKYYLFDLDL